jgi:hypothetical protein
VDDKANSQLSLGNAFSLGAGWQEGPGKSSTPSSSTADSGGSSVEVAAASRSTSPSNAALLADGRR